MIRKLIYLLAIVFAGIIMWQLFSDFEGNEQLNKTGHYYAETGPGETGAANLVTAVLVTYRGLDTLGEVTILFTVAAIIAFFMKASKQEFHPRRRVTEILTTAARILVPGTMLLGAYIFINGHLTPGGGFQGGAVISSGFVLMLLAFPEASLSHKTITWVESVSGFSFVLLGLLGIALAGGFLDTSFLPLGKFGSLFSAGAIPLIYIFIGLKVGAELSNVVGHMHEIQKEN
ncbi:MAG: Na(+)/H(+) antiporter subunit B [Bacteroidales bacterium]